MSLTELIDKYRTWQNTDFGMIVSFICLVTGASVNTLFSFSVKTIKRHSYPLRQFVVVALIVVLGLVLPVTDLILSPWNGIARIVLHLISIYALISFFGTIYITKKMLSIAKEINVEDAKKSA